MLIIGNEDSCDDNLRVVSLECILHICTPFSGIIRKLNKALDIMTLTFRYLAKVEYDEGMNGLIYCESFLRIHECEVEARRRIFT